MKLAVAVHFDGPQANAAAVAFDAWDAAEATKTFVSCVTHVEKAACGELDLRELPCVMQLLREHGLAPELILFEGFVHLHADGTPGLGQHVPVLLKANTVAACARSSARVSRRRRAGPMHQPRLAAACDVVTHRRCRQHERIQN